MNFRYEAFGLQIDSDVEFPSLRPGAGKGIDIRVRRGGEPALFSDGGPISRCRFDKHGMDTHIGWKTVGALTVRNGDTLLFNPTGGSDDLLRYAVQGVGLAILLHQRGLTVFHATAVEVDGVAVAIAGIKGAGKSTTAAALIARGHRLISDDVLAIGEDGFALPGWPEIKLFRHVVNASIRTPVTAMRQMGLNMDKWVCGTPDRFSDVPRRLARFYFPRPGTDLRLEDLPYQVRLTELMANTYVARFGDALLSGHRAASHLTACAGLLSKTKASYLRRPKNLHLLDELARVIERDLEADAPRQATRRLREAAG